MSLFKMFANYCRRSNDRAAQSSSGSSYSSSGGSSYDADSCANCAYFQVVGAKNYHCILHDFCYDSYEAKYNNIHHKRKCNRHVRNYGS